MVAIETVRGLTTRVLFLPVILTRFQEWNALLPESPKACQHYYAAFVKALLNGIVSARALSLPENSVTQNGLGLSLADITDAGYNRSPVTDHQKFSVRRNLGPGQRRGTRPWRWPRPRCWRRPRRRRCRCCCSGAGCWRGGRSRRWRWAPAYGRKDIDPTPTIDVVWRAGVSALSRINVNSGVIQRILASGKLMLQAGNSRPQQRHRAREVRSSHRRAA